MDPSRAVIAYSDGTDVPTVAPSDVARIANLRRDVEVLVGFSPTTPEWLKDQTVRGRTIMAGYGLTEPIASGRISYVPIRLSAVPRFVRDIARPDVGVITGVRRGSGFAYAENVGWGPALARHAGTVIVEVVDAARDLDGPMIEADIAHGLASFRPPDTTDHEIARHVLTVLPTKPTIQLGPGGVPDAIVAALDRPVHVWSGVITDSVCALMNSGLLLGDVTAAYTWGGAAIRELASAGRLRLVSVEETHDISLLSSIECFVGLNTALQLGLDGSVNVERVNGRVVAGIGGHADFCAGASRSPGGVSIVALRSTTKHGESTIVPRVETVSTPHCDVEVVVTEHGVADLRGIDDPARARRIIEVAAPEHRDALRSAL
jgi:acyl-CoA hydrolase